MADSDEGYPQYHGEPSALETLVLAERAIRYSDLEVAAKLMLAEWTVRSIVRKQYWGSSAASRLRHASETRNRVETRGRGCTS